MAYTSYKARDIVNSAVKHIWSVPEFQRGFVWKSTQVRDLAESLWLDFPMGSFLLWSSDGSVEPQVATDGQAPAMWIVDGQQRTTALCILFGRKPYWWDSAAEWERTLKRYDIRFDVHTKEPPFFVVSNAAIRKVREPRYVPLRDLLVLDTSREDNQRKLEDLAKAIKLAGLCDGMEAMEVYTRLDRVRKIRDKEVVTVTVDHELEDVVEIFSRLNSRGTRVTEADIYLGIVAARNPGWVRTTFLPHLNLLADAGFEISPNLLFRSLTAVGIKRIRFREIPDEFWNDRTILEAWEQTEAAWAEAVARFREYGILSNDPMPTEAALVTLIALLDRFRGAAFAPALYWFLQASRFGRYSGSGTTSLEEDLRDVGEADSLGNAVSRLLRRFDHQHPLEADDFLRDYGDSRFGRFLLYLLVYRNQAVDWDERGHRIGFEGIELLAGFRPQWHHIFPRKFLQGKVSDDCIDALANIAVIGPSINIRISAKDPMDYIRRYQITPDKLSQQFIEPNVATMAVGRYETWLADRAERLAGAGNEFLAELKGDL